MRRLCPRSCKLCHPDKQRASVHIASRRDLVWESNRESIKGSMPVPMAPLPGEMSVDSVVVDSGTADEHFASSRR